MPKNVKGTPKLRRQLSEKNPINHLVSPRKLKSSENTVHRFSLLIYVKKHVHDPEQMRDFLSCMKVFNSHVHEWFANDIRQWCMEHVTGWSRDISEKCTAMSDDGQLYVMLDSELGTEYQRTCQIGVDASQFVEKGGQLFFPASLDSVHDAFNRVCRKYAHTVFLMIGVDDTDLKVNHSLKIKNTIAEPRIQLPPIPDEPPSPRLKQFALSLLDMTHDEYEVLVQTRELDNIPPPPC